MRLSKTLAVVAGFLLVASVSAALRVSAHPAHGAASASGRYALAAGYQVPTGPSPVATLPVSFPAGAGAPATPAAPARPTTPKAPTRRPAALPVPRAGALPAVAPLKALRSADAVVLVRQPLTAAQVGHVAHLPGLAAVDEVDTGTIQVAGAPVVTFGVDPATFRQFTPSASAASDRLWQYLAGGALVSSYEMATDRRLHLGSVVPVGPAGSTPVRGWLGAFASIGLPGVDLLVGHAYSRDLGLAPGTGLVVSAPNASGPQLQQELQQALPGAAVEFLHPDQVSGVISGNGLSSHEQSAVVAAALSKVGRPYVWGGAGPNVFDCSGLVQWSFAQAGIAMPRTADDQFLTGQHISLAAAQPGDLLFWTYDPNDPGFVDHTAIYLGNGMMVVAPHTGLDVQVVPVPTADFAGVVHVLLASG